MTRSSKLLIAISSTLADLSTHRQAAVDACHRVGARTVLMEDMSAIDADAVAEWFHRIDEADIYLGIIGFRYGYVPPGQKKSLLELEYERAGIRGIPRLMFFMSDQHPVRVQDVETGAGASKLNRFKEEVSRTAMVSFFGSPDELRIRVLESLSRFQAERIAPKRALLLIPTTSAKYEELRFQLAELLDSVGFVVVRLDTITAGAVWANAVADAIRASDLIIADVTDANPNVMYELGYAHALKKPTVLLANSATKLSRLPSDVQSYQILMYDTAKEAILRTHLSRVLRAYLGSGAS